MISAKWKASWGVRWSKRRRPHPMIWGKKRGGRPAAGDAPDGKENWIRSRSRRRFQFSSSAVEFHAGAVLNIVLSAVCFVGASGASYWHAPAHGEPASS